MRVDDPTREVHRLDARRPRDLASEPKVCRDSTKHVREVIRLKYLYRSEWASTLYDIFWRRDERES